MCQWKWKSDPCELWTCEPTTELLKKWCTILACSGLQSRGIRRKRRQRAWQHGFSLWKIQSCRISWCPWIQIFPCQRAQKTPTHLVLEGCRDCVHMLCNLKCFTRCCGSTLFGPACGDRIGNLTRHQVRRHSLLDFTNSQVLTLKHQTTYHFARGRKII